MAQLEPGKMVLFQNTIMLYILIFSSYFFNFITIPYQTRILGPEYFGRLGFAMALMAYFRLFIDFGFILSATEEIARNRHDKHELSKIVISVNLVKILLGFAGLAAISLICALFPRFGADFKLYLLCFLSVISAAFLPDFLYRGLEKMKTITIIAVLIQLFFVSMIFVFMKSAQDYLMVPLFTTIGNLIAMAGVYYHAFKSVGIRLVRVEPAYILQTFKRSRYFFYSRIASTIYSATNTFLIGIFNPAGSRIVGLYSSADKLVNTARKGFSPVADSLYPYMVKNRDFRLALKILALMVPPVIFVCILIGVNAEPFCEFLLGSQFRDAGHILRLLMPVIAISSAVYILGFPILTPMGLARYGNFSTIAASIFHVSILLFLIFTKRFTVENVCYLTCASELLVLLFRIHVIWKNRHLISWIRANAEQSDDCVRFTNDRIN
jgi:PST family polysaccharide transporter